jgi:tetratricopeptide (TPR) repeat protein
MAALRDASAEPTAKSERKVADAYRKVGILDQSYEHFNRAVHLDPRDGWAYDGRARIWRDWGFPEHGLGDAYRAVHFLHDAPEALNTLGTLLFALGQRSEARKCFERALRQSPDAVYALNNLCYTALMGGDLDGARAACRRAVEIEPHSTTARNNLALLLMAEGDVAGAAREFAESNNPAALHYNLGLVYMAAKRYAEAAAAFEKAVRLNPALPLVNERLRQARSLAGGTDARH